MDPDYILEIIDKSGRKIRLTKRQWSHIRIEHPEIEDDNLIKETLEKPDKITQPYASTKNYYFKYHKYREPPDQYLMVIVNYLNGDGFVITAYYVSYVR